MTTKAPISADMEALRRSTAAMQTALREQMRVIAALRRRQVPLREIGRVASISHVEVKRRAQRAVALGEEPGPYEIILKRTAGEITDDEMMARLRNIEYTTRVPAADEQSEFAVPGGTLAEIGKAYDEGLLSANEHDDLIGSVRVRTA